MFLFLDFWFLMGRYTASLGLWAVDPGATRGGRHDGGAVSIALATPHRGHYEHTDQQKTVAEETLRASTSALRNLTTVIRQDVSFWSFSTFSRVSIPAQLAECDLQLAVAPYSRGRGRGGDLYLKYELTYSHEPAIHTSPGDIVITRLRQSRPLFAGPCLINPGSYGANC